MKLKLGVENFLYPSLTVLVGANVDGKPTYVTIAFVGILDYYTISVALNPKRYAITGIKENQTFSINIPSADLVKETDYCGIVSGRNVDKGALFENFYGVLGTAPMIQGCPVNMECRLVQTLSLARHEVFIGEIAEAYCDEEYLTNGKADIAKIQPFLFGMHDKGYWRVGENFAQAWSVGKDLKGR